MMPKLLTISAFGPYPSKATIDFTTFNESGVFLITGKTGSGKTMIFDAIAFALFGQSSGGTRDGQSMRCINAKDDDKTFVELTFILHNQEYTINRSPAYKKEKNKTATTSNATLTMPDNKIISGTNPVNDKIKEILKIDYNQFKQISMIAQGDFTKLLLSTSKEREEVLRNLFNTQNYKKLENDIDIKKKEIENKYKLTIQEIERIKSNINYDGDYDEYLKQLQQDLELKQKHQQEISNEYTSLDKQVSNVQMMNKKLKDYEIYKEKRINYDNQKEYYEGINSKIKVLEGVNSIKPIYDNYQKEINTNNRLNIELKEKQLLLESINKQLEEFNNTQLLQLESTKKILVKHNESKIHLEQELIKYQNLKKDYEEKENNQKEYDILIQQNDDLTTNINKKQKLLNKDKETVSKKSEIELYLKDLEATGKELINKKANIHDLSQAYDKLQSLRDKLADRKDSHAKVVNQYNAINQEYMQSQEILLSNQAAHLASNLKEGTPCPVCGSTNHPQLAVIKDNNITANSLDLLKEKVSASFDEMNQSSQSVLNLVKDVENQEELLSSKSETLGVEQEIGKNIIAKMLSDCINEVERHQKEFNDYKDKLTYIEKLIKSNESTQKDLDELNSKQEVLLEKITDYKTKLAVYDERLKDYDVTKEVEVSNKLEELLKTIKELETNITNLTTTKDKLHENHLILSQSITSIMQQIKTSDTDLKNYQETYNFKLKELFIGEKQFLDNIDNLNQLQALKKEYDDYSKDYDLVKSQEELTYKDIKDYKYQDEQDLITKLETLKQTKEQADKEWIESSSLYKTKGDYIKQLRQLDKDNEKELETLQRYSNISNIISGTNKSKISLERYVLAAYFDDVLNYANDILKRLSQGRYILLRRDYLGKGNQQQGLELDVLDTENGGRRDVKTLSGGESFKAALSLALGLSRMIESNAGGIELNTLFIDEGFGTLDDQSLDDAINCLLDVQQDGKLVGIISHVNELKQRIERKIIISRNDKQSTITIV